MGFLFSGMHCIIAQHSELKKSFIIPWSLQLHGYYNTVYWVSQNGGVSGTADFQYFAIGHFCNVFKLIDVSSAINA